MAVVSVPRLGTVVIRVNHVLILSRKYVIFLGSVLSQRKFEVMDQLSDGPLL